MGVINKIEVKNVEYDVEDLKAQEKLAELEDRLDEGVGGVSDLMQEITWSELKTLRDNSELVPGMKYRITDYVTTTVQAETKSANHPFDVIVEAVSENELSELAQAIQHEGDTYFDGNDLSAWQLWYDLDNDTNKYEWADTEIGKGVIYRMIDEKRNDCPYDFKNIMFGDYFTFSYTVDGVIYDGTVHSEVKFCYGNVIKQRWIKGVQNLNDIVFKNTIFDYGCYSNTFDYGCYSNTFGDYCYSNTFGYNCNSNTFGDNCYSNTFGYNCNSNTFGDNCYSNTFGDYCYSNTFGDDCNNRQLNARKTSITLNEEYYDDGNNALVPIKHPDLSTQPSILPYKFMGQYVYEQLIPNKKGEEVDVPFSSFLVPDPLIIETTSIYSLKKITDSDYAKPYIFYVNDDYFRIRTSSISESENVEYFRIVYTSMPKEGGYYYSDVGLYEKGILVLLKGNLNDTTALTSLYNGDVHIKPVSLGQGYYYYDIPNDYKVSSAGISINSTSDITTILYFTPGGGDPRSLKFSKDSESYFVDLTDLVKEAKDYLVTVTIE